VAVALKAVDGKDISRKGPWESSAYETWLGHWHGIAAGEGVRPDAVEMAYFNYGRKVAAQALDVVGRGACNNPWWVRCVRRDLFGGLDGDREPNGCRHFRERPN
jgi:hypothetical protein